MLLTPPHVDMLGLRAAKPATPSTSGRHKAGLSFTHTFVFDVRLPVLSPLHLALPLCLFAFVPARLQVRQRAQ